MMNRGEENLNPGTDAEVTDLVRRLQNDPADEAASERLFKRFYRWTYGIFRKRGVPPDRAEDLVQETMIRGLREIRSLKRPELFRAWLRSVANNVFRNEMRQISRRPEVPLGSEDDGRPIDIVDPGPTPDEDLQEQEYRQRLWDAINQFPPKMRQCFILRYKEGLKYREIAAVLKIPIDTVKSHLAQGRKRLKDRFGVEIDLGEDE